MMEMENGAGPQPRSPDEQFAVIEACLFAAGHPLTYARLGEVLGLTPSACADTVEKMLPASCIPSPESPENLTATSFNSLITKFSAILLSFCNLFSLF